MLSLRQAQSWLLAGALLALALPARAAEVDKLLPDDADVVAVLNVKQILDAPFVKKHLLEKIKEALKSNEEVAKVTEALGFDPLKDLTSVTAAGSGIGPDAKGLGILHGQFDTAKIAAKAEEFAKQKGDLLKIHKEGGQTLYEIKNPDVDKPLYAGLVDKATIVVSNDKEMIHDAFAKAAGKKTGKLKKDLQALIEKADADQSLWLAAPGGGLSKLEQAGDDKAKKSLAKVDSIGMGVTVSKDIKLSLWLMAKNADNAKELAEEVKDGLNQAKGLLAVLAGNMEKLAPLVDVVNGIKVATDGNMVTLKGEASEEFIEKILKKE